MDVQLEAIQFNYDPNSAAVDALNIRRNAAQMVTVPEWQRGLSVNPEDSPAAYSIKDTQGNTLTIQAKFSRNNPNIQTAEVRAIDGTFNPPPSGCLGIIYQMFQALMEALFGNVLGEVKGKKVTFLQNGQTNFETFELQNVRLWTLGIGIHVVNWRWQYRLQPNDPWTDFGTTLHRIYCLLETPKAPWVQTPYNAGNTQLPWTEVLDYACQWAYWSGSLDDAAAAVTRNVYGLGPNVVTYDCPGGGSSHYSGGSFDCTAFLERLHGGMGNGQYVNCSDCATFLSTFANILGCDLWQSQMASWFELNAILAIGSNVWQTACGWAHFSYHEVAWKNACTSNDEVFDACLQVDGDADPTQPPHTPLLPINLRFGNPGDLQYRDRLATPAGRPNCNPQPQTRQRRMVF